ncbi:MAG TPA: type IV secretion system DNA-binding domain-containing protein [Burkholderiales bacterium]|nr:type IV secretion system DNA-binding domain-containing protein [Burkholderiales bacterium]
MEQLTIAVDWFTHGWHAFLGAWLVVLIGTWAGLRLRGANKGRFLTAPIAAAFVAPIAMLAAAALKTGLDAAGIAGPLWAYGTFGIFPIFGLLAGLLSRNPAQTVIHRGTVIQDGRPAQRWGRGGGLTLAGTLVPPADETKHFKMLGTTGTGKSTAIRELLGGALARGDRAVIADPDGGYLARFHDATRGDVILNPFDPRAHTWDLYGEITHAHDVEQLARSLIPDHEGSDRSWRGYARNFFTAVTRQTNDAGVRSLPELYRLLSAADSDELRILVAGTPAQPFLEGGNERMFGSIRSVTGAALTALDYLATQRGPPLAVRNWVRRGRGVLFLPYQANEIAALRSVISAWMRLAIFECMTLGEGDARLWFVVDELDALGVIDGLKDALARLRKFGGRCVLGFQSIAQVSSTYGHGEAQTIVENCGNSLILRCSASENGGTARFASKLIGEREVIRPTVSRTRRSGLFADPHHSVSRSEQHITEAAVLPAEVEQLPDLHGYVKFASHPAWLRVRLPPP